MHSEKQYTQEERERKIVEIIDLLVKLGIVSLKEESMEVDHHE